MSSARRHGQLPVVRASQRLRLRKNSLKISAADELDVEARVSVDEHLSTHAFFASVY
jgi:hypothetical protein